MKILGSRALGRAFGLAALTAAAFVPVDASEPPSALASRLVLTPTFTDTLGIPAAWRGELFGRSGQLRARFVPLSDPVGAEVLELFHGAEAHGPGVYPIAHAALDQPLALIAMLPFSEKQNGRIGDYRLGSWPAERRATRSEAYRNPVGFIEVTRENQDLWVSDHFQLRDFLTHDQASVWPKYLVLREELIDKLELVIEDLGSHGTLVSNIEVMSGFRHPHYNATGVGKGGRARDSRHQFGDAADIFVDNDRNGRMDDLNRDGRVNVKDARVILAAVERVESRHPELVGGAGLYTATNAHGPFAHIDARGRRARWGA